MSQRGDDNKDEVWANCAESDIRHFHTYTQNVPLTHAILFFHTLPVLRSAVRWGDQLSRSAQDWRISGKLELSVLKPEKSQTYFGYKLFTGYVVGNYFSHFIDCLSILLMVSFSEQKLFGLMESHLFIFAYVISAFRIKCKKSLPRPVSRSLVSIFSSRSFTVSGLMFKF